MVASVYKNTPANKAGIEAGDVIISVNGKKTDNLNSLKKIFLESDLRPGDVVNFKILKDNKEHSISMKLESLN